MKESEQRTKPSNPDGFRFNKVPRAMRREIGKQDLSDPPVRKVTNLADFHSRKTSA